MQTFKKIRAVPYCGCIYKLSKISGKYHRDISEQENQKCLNNWVVFKGTGCIKEMLDHALSFEGEPKKVKEKIVEKILYLIAHKGRGFDSYAVFIILHNGQVLLNYLKTKLVLFHLKYSTVM